MSGIVWSSSTLDCIPPSRRFDRTLRLQQIINRTNGLTFTQLFAGIAEKANQKIFGSQLISQEVDNRFQFSISDISLSDSIQSLRNKSNNTSKQSITHFYLICNYFEIYYYFCFGFNSETKVSSTPTNSQQLIDKNVSQRSVGSVSLTLTKQSIDF
jgi:hypothetical protein